MNQHGGIEMSEPDHAWGRSAGNDGLGILIGKQASAIGTFTGMPVPVFGADRRVADGIRLIMRGNVCHEGRTVQTKAKSVRRRRVMRSLLDMPIGYSRAIGRNGHHAGERDAFRSRQDGSQYQRPEDDDLRDHRKAAASGFVSGARERAG